jgi:hypothetical protein
MDIRPKRISVGSQRGEQQTDPRSLVRSPFRSHRRNAPNAKKDLVSMKTKISVCLKIIWDIFGVIVLAEFMWLLVKWSIK